MREGPPVVYICKSGPTAMSFTDTKKLLAFIRWPKSTPTGQQIREWLASFDEKPKAAEPKLDWDKIKAEGFGPEAHEEKTVDPITGEEIPDDPITGTKMII